MPINGNIQRAIYDDIVKNITDNVSVKCQSVNDYGKVRSFAGTWGGSYTFIKVNITDQVRSQFKWEMVFKEI